MTMRTHLCALGTVRRSTLRWLTPWALEPELVRGNWANGKIGLLLKMLNCYPLCQVSKSFTIVPMAVKM